MTNIRKRINFVIHRVWKLMKNFWPLGLLYGLVLVFAILEYYHGLTFFLIGFVLVFVAIPQNIVHGLIGARGSIRVFFCFFILWTFAFSGVYYWGFFKNSVISESENKESLLFQYQTPPLKASLGDTIYIEGFYDSLGRKPFFVKKNEMREPLVTKVSYGLVLRNTFLVSLTQQPSDFFNLAISQYEGEKEYHMDILEWLLIVQIFISWILFGVFISILYNKFRRES